MLACKHCQTHNTLDSTFCRKCGTALPEEDLQRALEKHMELVAQGQLMLREERVDEAELVAEASTNEHPASVPAWTLKAQVHERLGQVAEAIEAYERVIDLNPDSAIEKLKLNQLRNRVVQGVEPDPAPRKRAAALAAVAAVVLFAGVGALGAFMANRGNAQAAAPTGGEAVAQGFSTPGPTVAANTGPTNPNPAAGAMNGGVDPSQQAAPPMNPVQTPTQPPAQASGQPSLPPAGNSLPRIGGSGSPSPLQGEIEPFNPGPVTLQPSGGTPPPPRGQDPDPDPSPSTGGAGTPAEGANGGAQNQDPPRRTDPGRIEIRASAGSSPTRITEGGGQDSGAGGGNAVQALIRTAQNQWQSGNLEGAAASYQRALQMGADPATVNERLRRLYARLGRNTDAIAAYRRAESALEARLRSGDGDRGGNQAKLDTVRQALRVLQGG